MMTADNPGRWVDYYDDLCYINGTYRLGEKDTFVSSRNQTLEKAEPINYYQWAHYILLFQTLLWYVPHAFWRFTRSCTAFHLMSILAYGIKNEKKPSYIPWAQHVQEHLKFAYKVQKRPSVVYFYLITKWLYVGIAFLQLSIITYFIGEGDYFWGLKKFMMATSGGRFTWHQLEEFPFVSYCDSIKFELGQWKPSSLECVMPMNMFLDKLGERDPKRRVVHIFLKEHLHLEGFIASYTEGKLERSDCIRNGEAIVDNF
uniref:Innexin n=1 Tax=Acrobeloides nanus TaxID=290746 RepID=A0A914C681_9BILA